VAFSGKKMYKVGHSSDKRAGLVVHDLAPTTLLATPHTREESLPSLLHPYPPNLCRSPLW